MNAINQIKGRRSFAIINHLNAGKTILTEKLQLLGGAIQAAGAYELFDEELYREDYVTPVFFGSAMYNFDVKEFLDTFVSIAPPPRPRDTANRSVSPEEDKFTGFVFKIHANLDPNHRDRLAFCRICSPNLKQIRNLLKMYQYGKNNEI